jgi:hypothetical protein
VVNEAVVVEFGDQTKLVPTVAAWPMKLARLGYELSPLRVVTTEEPVVTPATVALSWKYTV